VKSERDTGPPVYQQIKSTLRQEISGGHYPPDSAFITQRALCERFGVSNTTAVRVLNDLVGEGLLVRRRGLGTFVAERTTAERGVERVISCILHGLQDSYVAQVLSGVESVCNELGYRLLLTDTGESAHREEEALRHAQRAGVDGVVLYPVEGRGHAGVLSDLRSQDVPVVMIDRYRPDVICDAVTVDNDDVGYQLTKGLIALGHERIATLWSETDCTSVHERLAGHIRALRENGLPIRSEFTALRRYWPTDEHARQLQLQHLIELPEPPTAMLCSNGYVVAAAVHDLIALGVAVPDTIDIAGMDDAGPYNLLPLTVLCASLPSKELGRQAAQLLNSRLSSADALGATERVILPVTIRNRQSTAAHLRAVSTSDI
jgi:DNA-binding LacI/PurR family transcriptional regulator